MRFVPLRTVLPATVSVLALAAGVALGGIGLTRIGAAANAAVRVSESGSTAIWNASLTRAAGEAALAAVALAALPSAESERRLADAMALLDGALAALDAGDRAAVALDRAELAAALARLNERVHAREAGVMTEAAGATLRRVLSGTLADAEGPAAWSEAAREALAVLDSAAEATVAAEVERRREAFAAVLDRADAVAGDTSAHWRERLAAAGLGPDNPFAARLAALAAAVEERAARDDVRARFAALLDSVRRTGELHARAVAESGTAGAVAARDGAALVLGAMPLFLIAGWMAPKRRRLQAPPPARAAGPRPAATSAEAFALAERVEAALGERAVADLRPGVPARVAGKPEILGAALAALAATAEPGRMAAVRVTLCDTGADGSAILRFDLEPAAPGADETALKALAEMLGARLGVTPGETGGLRRWLILSLAVAESGPVEKPLAGRSVIVVGSEPRWRAALAHMLEGGGATVREAGGGEEADELAEEETPDLLAVLGPDGAIRLGPPGAAEMETVASPPRRGATWAAARRALDDRLPVLDFDHLRAAFGDDVPAMLGLFLETTEPPARALAEGLTADIAAVREAAHKAAGAARMAGAVRLADLLSRLELAAVAGDTGAMGRLRPAVAEALDRTVAAIRAQGGGSNGGT